MSELTQPEFVNLLVDAFGNDASKVVQTIRPWLDRGDAVAVYRNEDLSHPECGHIKIASLGSALAQIEGSVAPHRMPDIGSAVNWRYCLVGTYREDV